MTTHGSRRCALGSEEAAVTERIYDGLCLSIAEALGLTAARALCEGLEPREVRMHPVSYTVLLMGLPRATIDGRGYAQTDIDLPPKAQLMIPPVRLLAICDPSLPPYTAVFDCGWTVRLSG